MALYEGTQQWLDAVPFLTEEEVTGEQFDLLIAQVTNGSALQVLLGLLAAERQALFVQLATVPITTPAQMAQASVLQGRIQGIDRAKETVLEMAQRAGARAGTEAGGTNNG